MKTLIVAGVMLAALSVTAQAQILKCVGKDGKIEYATSCSAGTTQQNTGVSSKPAPPPPAAAKSDTKDASKDKAAPKTLADREAEFRKRQAEQQDTAAKDAQKATANEDRQRSCASAQGTLLALKNRQRTFRIDPKTGERLVYEEADFVREIANVERQIAESCKA